MNQPISLRRRIAGFVIALAGITAAGAASHATPTLTSAAPVAVVCDAFSCYDDGFGSTFSDPYAGWSGSFDPYASYPSDLSGLWDPGVSGTGWDPSWSSYDYGTPAGGSGASSVISDYSDPGL